MKRACQRQCLEHSKNALRRKGTETVKKWAKIDYIMQIQAKTGIHLWRLRS